MFIIQRNKNASQTEVSVPTSLKLQATKQYGAVSALSQQSCCIRTAAGEKKGGGVGGSRNN